MKFIVRVFIPAGADGRGSSLQYVVDHTNPNHGAVVAAKITEAVDTRPDPDGRLAELRRRVVALGKQRPKVATKPDGSKTPGSRVQYFAESRLTGRQVRVELRHYTKPDGIPANADEPPEG